MKFKRAMAFILDMFIVSFIGSLIMIIPGLNKNLDRINKAQEEYFDIVMKSDKIDAKEVSKALYNFNEESLTMEAIILGVTFLYFGVSQYIMNGQTLGKKLLHIKVVPIKGTTLNPSLFILRSLLITGIPFSIIGIITTKLINNIDTWMLVNSIVGYIENAFMLVTIGFILFRQDERGLHDLICKTKVIESKKEPITE